ncbi:hypothetical protein HanRHA438_Chr07g0299921 [Helianthus annuus]|nr:hypothetical protein HanRHA438_Chr07g0299921 [Helianthus annuus]
MTVPFIGTTVPIEKVIKHIRWQSVRYVWIFGSSSNEFWAPEDISFARIQALIVPRSSVTIQTFNLVLFYGLILESFHYFVYDPSIWLMFYVLL